MHRNDPKNKSNIVMTPQKYTRNLYTPKNIHFLKTPRNIEIQNFETKTMIRAYVCMKISEYPMGARLSCASAQSDQYLSVSPEEALNPWLPLERL